MTFTRGHILCVLSLSVIGITIPSCASKKQDSTDIHTGFIVNTGSEVYFIHSSYVEPYRVVREKAIESKILAASNYRVLGSITSDALFIEEWLLKKEIVKRAA